MPPRYDRIDTFSQGRAAVGNLGKNYWQLLRPDGQPVTDAHFDSSDSEPDEPSVAVRGTVMTGIQEGKGVVVTTNGKVIWRAKD